MAESDSDHAVDATGLKCPEPVMMLHAAIRRAEAGETVLLTATDLLHTTRRSKLLRVSRSQSA